MLFEAEFAVIVFFNSFSVENVSLVNVLVDTVKNLALFKFF